MRLAGRAALNAAPARGGRCVPPLGDASHDVEHDAAIVVLRTRVALVSVSHSRGALQPPQKWIRCKQQRIYKPLTSVASFLWQRRRPSPNEKSPPRGPMG